MQEKEVVISFNHITKTYHLYKNDKQRFLGLIFKKKIPCKHFKAMNDVSFQIYKGESVGILGKNGAGKSTLLKIITGVTFPDHGKVIVKGQVSALLELSAGFDLEMTGRENIYLKGYILGLKDDKIKEIEEAVVEFAELGDFIDQPVRTYSSGMKARLGFAINANVHPDILVIDEALSVGDAAFSEKCRTKVQEIIEAGATVLFVSHSIDSVKRFCSRGILLDKGAILADGDIDTIADQYQQVLEKEKLLKEKKKKQTAIIR